MLQKLSEYREFYGKDIKMTEVGRLALSINRVVLYDDLTLTTPKELKNIPELTLKALAVKDFTNTNSTFFMLDRGLVDQTRQQLLAKGQEIYDSFWRDKQF